MSGARGEGYEAVIGLEVHAQLRTQTKIFCPCPTRFGAAPNSQTCPVCLGHPGALPVLNRRAVELALRAAVALGCEVAPLSVFARKNYFYPDLPKGYQISQYDRPLAHGGVVEFDVEGRPRRIGLIRLHLEEDAGKLVHNGVEPFSRVDLNRAGVPLVEIVTQPELRSAAEAALFLQRLRSVLRYLDVCDGNMEEGSLRCDANVSLRPRGESRLGTRTEVKNINSFRNVQRALDFEIERMAGLLDAGGRVEQETVLWDADAGVTRPMRDKEEAEDYRYFPEPDLPPLAVDERMLLAIRSTLPELPAEKKRRIMERYGLSGTEAEILILDVQLADYFEAVAGLSGDARASANWILNDLLRELNRRGLDPAQIPLAPAHLVELIEMVAAGTVSASAARQELLGRACDERRSPRELAAELGLEQDSDEGRLRELAERVVRDHPQQVAIYRGGKLGVLGFLIGRVMQASGGKANPSKVRDLLEELLE